MSAADNSTPNVILGVQHDNFPEPFWDLEDYAGRAILTQYAMCLGQAKLLHGQDVKDLPEPISVMLVITDGLKFHLSAFQLNTLETSGTAKKNIFWQEPELLEIAQVADYVSARPVVDGYDPEVFKKLAAMYLSGATK